MILFALRCASGHEFEAWFRDGDGFEAQQKAGEVACPHCGDAQVEKAVIARFVPAAAAPIVTKPSEAGRREAGAAQAEHEFRGPNETLPIMRAARQPTEDVFGTDDRQRKGARRAV